MAMRTILLTSLLATTAFTNPLQGAAKASSSEPSKTKPTTTLLATATSNSYGLNDAAKADGKLCFGTAADIPGAETSDPYYMREFNNTHDFGCTTPANIMKVRQKMSICNRKSNFR